MNIEKFESDLPSLYENIYESTHPLSRELESLMEEIPGMARENNLELLNFAASTLEPGEVYLEVGTFKGLSLIGAMMNNHEKEFCAIDNFSQFGGTKDELMKNVNRYVDSRHLNFIDGDFRQILKSDFLGGKKAGVFYYDGDHSFSSQYRALKLIQQHLSDKALIIVDDTNQEPVARANDLFSRYRDEVNLIYSFKCEFKGPWWNGVQVFTYDKNLKNTTHSVLRNLMEYIEYLILRERWEKNILRHFPYLLKLIRGLRGWLKK